MALPLHELAALGTATCWAITGLFAADAVRALGPFYFNLIRQVFVTLLLAAVVLALGVWELPGWSAALILALSGVIGILIGDTLNFAAMARIGPRRTGAIFAMNAPMTAVLGWAFLGEALSIRGISGIALTATGVALAILGRPRSNAHRFETLQGTLFIGLLLGLGAAFGQAGGSRIWRPVMGGGTDPYFASLLRVGASGLTMAVISVSPFGPTQPARPSGHILLLTAGTAVLGLLIGVTLFLYALQSSKTGILATLAETSRGIILPLLWLRPAQRPSGLSLSGDAVAVVGLALVYPL